MRHYFPLFFFCSILLMLTYSCQVSINQTPEEEAGSEIQFDTVIVTQTDTILQLDPETGQENMIIVSNTDTLIRTDTGQYIPVK